ncbi:MAG: Dabb family protein [Clostridia bacterium]|nr:Dabb family protein [Clostridia bacterium]
MVKHMIIWKLKDEVSDKAACAKEIKEALEGLVGKIDGLTEMHILTESFPASTGDIMMDSTFESAEALSNYQKHPLHVEIANGKVRPNVDTRLSFDYETK